MNISIIKTNTGVKIINLSNTIEAEFVIRDGTCADISDPGLLEIIIGGSIQMGIGNYNNYSLDSNKLYVIEDISTSEIQLMYFNPILLQFIIKSVDNLLCGCNCDFLKSDTYLAMEANYLLDLYINNTNEIIVSPCESNSLSDCTSLQLLFGKKINIKKLKKLVALKYLSLYQYESQFYSENDLKTLFNYDKMITCINNI